MSDTITADPFAAASKPNNIPEGFKYDVDEKGLYVWLTDEEIAKFNRMIGKPYVKKNPRDGKATSDKEFFFVPEEIIPTMPPAESAANAMANTVQSLAMFFVGKFHRNKMEKVNVKESLDGRTMVRERNARKQRWSLPEGDLGVTVLLDEEADMLMSARKFLAMFVPDPHG